MHAVQLRRRERREVGEDGWEGASRRYKNYLQNAIVERRAGCTAEGTNRIARFRILVAKRYYEQRVKAD